MRMPGSQARRPDHGRALPVGLCTTPLHAGIVGLSKLAPQYGFAIMDRVMQMPGEQIMPPAGVESPEWLKTLK